MAIRLIRLLDDIRRAVRGACLTCIPLLLFFSLSAAAEPVSLNLRDVDIQTLITSVSEITGKAFIVDPRVKGKVTFISSRPIPSEDLYGVFLSILEVHGFAAVPGDKVIKIVPAAGAKQEDIPTVEPSSALEADQMSTQLIPLQHNAASELAPALRPLLPPQAQLVAVAGANALLVTDGAANLRRIADLVRRIDMADAQNVEVIRLQHATATDVARVLTALEGHDGGARFVADVRTNSILISGGAAERPAVRALITDLDRAAENADGIDVIRLRHSRASDLAPLIENLGR